MKRYCCIFFILVALVACSRKEPTPTSLPSPTPSVGPALVPSFTPTPQGSPVPRITVVPSATRLAPTQQDVPQDTETLPTSTTETPPPPVPSSTPTRKVIDAAATATPSPTPTLPESPLPTPSLVGPSPLPVPERETPQASTAEPTSAIVISTLTSTPDGTTSTSTPTPTDSDGPNRTSTPTLSPTPEGEAWPFEGVFTYHDEQAHKLFIAGQVVNNTDSSQRIMSVTPVVYDAQGAPVTTAADFAPSSLNYSELLGKVSLAPGQRLPLGFSVSLPEGIAFENNYRILVEAVSTESARNDIVTTQTSYNIVGWPNSILVEGTFVNQGSRLTDYLLITVSVYDVDERVIGLGWSYETASGYLASGEHAFDVKAFMLEVVGGLGININNDNGVHVEGFGN